MVAGIGDQQRVAVRLGPGDVRMPILPLAPPLFSTMNCWPSSFVMPSAIRRPVKSTNPPGATGTTRVTGRVG